MWCCPVVEVGLKTKHKILIAPTKASVKCVTAYIRLWLVILWLWCVMLLIWLLLRSLVGYCCACGLLMWLCCCAIGDIHSGVKSGCKLVTLLSFLWYDKLWGPSQRVVTFLLFWQHIMLWTFLLPLAHSSASWEASTLLNNEHCKWMFHESYSQMPNMVFVWQETAVHRPLATVDFPTSMLEIE